MSVKYKMVKTYYLRGMWNIDKVRNAVDKGFITEAEFAEITGEDY